MKSGKHQFSANSHRSESMPSNYIASYQEASAYTEQLKELLSNTETAG